jgi:hypothetical protein
VEVQPKKATAKGSTKWFTGDDWISITEGDAQWGEHVTDTEYRADAQ